MRDMVRPLIPALAVTAVAAALALAGAGGRAAVTLAVLAVQIVFALGWLAFTETAGSAAPATALLVAAVAADLLAWTDDGAGVGASVGVVALAVIGALGWQLVRRERHRVTESVAGLVAGVVLVVLLAHLISVRASRGGRALLTVAVLSVAVAMLGSHALDAVLPRPRIAPGALRGWPGALVAVAAGGATGFVIGGAAAPLSAASGLATGLAVAVAAVCADVAVDVSVADFLDPRRLAAARPVATLLPLVAAAPVAYAAARLLIG